ncbi:hypothetical protein HU175_13470 [Spirosoma sp. KUDC1026]|nr:hypothetical protein HU175_13470 [Spirosoma sp. KUDC1026]
MVVTRQFLLVSFGWLLTLPIRAQSTESVQYSAELGGFAATSAQTPFWLRANQYGTVPLQGSLATVRLGAMKEYKLRRDTLNRRTSRFDWGFGLNVVANTAPASYYNTARFFLPDAYGKVRLGAVELYAGNRREVAGLGDTTLTSGFVAWSGNALPYPKIQLHTPDFVPLGFTKKLIAFRAGYAHGWLINTYIQGSYLHQKYLYVRVGKPNWRVWVTGGLNHQVQWGGRADYLVGTPLAVDGRLPTTFRDYLSMITGHYPGDVQNDRYTDFDGTNRIGNHLGSYDFSVEWRGNKANWLLYHQHLYEDASGLAFQNVPDGLTGLRYLNRRPSNARFRVKRLLVEWLSTTNQSGAVFDQSARYQGADNYFNHSQYREGWTYQGRTIGTPFIAPYTELSTRAVNEGGSFFPNNRLVAWYVGGEGAFRKGTVLTARLSYSRNFGTYSRPFTETFHQFSSLLSARWPLDKRASTVLTTSLSLDRGQLFPTSTGGFVSLRKAW